MQTNTNKNQRNNKIIRGLDLGKRLNNCRSKYKEKADIDPAKRDQTSKD